MGDEQHRDFSLEGVDRGGKMLGGLMIEVRGGFIEDQDSWPFEKRPCSRCL